MYGRVPIARKVPHFSTMEDKRSIETNGHDKQLNRDHDLLFFVRLYRYTKRLVIMNQPFHTFNLLSRRLSLL